MPHAQNGVASALRELRTKRVGTLLRVLRCGRLKVVPSFHRFVFELSFDHGHKLVQSACNGREPFLRLGRRVAFRQGAIHPRDSPRLTAILDLVPISLRPGKLLASSLIGVVDDMYHG